MSLVGILTGDVALLSQNSDELVEYKERAVGLAASYRIPSKYFDDICLNLTNTANSIKVNIVSIGGNTGLGSICYTADTSYLTSTYGSMVTGVATALGSSLGLVGVGSTQIVAYGIIKYDVLDAYNYPKIETIDASTENPFIGEGYVNVTSGNSGIGKDTRYRTSAGSDVGTVFAVSTISPCTGASIASSVASLIVQYNNTTSGIASYTTLATNVKKFKTEYQFHAWSYSRKIQENTDDSNEQTTLANVLSDPVYGGPY